MKPSKIQDWFDELRQIWLSKDIRRVSDLLSTKFEYHESPFEPPLTTVAEVESAWQEVLEQDILELDITVLGADRDIGTASYSLRYTDPSGKTHSSRGAYYVRLDLLGKAVEFRQWWMSVVS